MKNRKLRMTIVAPVGRSRLGKKIFKNNRYNAARGNNNNCHFEAFRHLEGCYGGRISRDDMSIIPTTRMARTTVIDVNNTRIPLIVFVFIPLTFADSSSNVIDRSSW